MNNTQLYLSIGIPTFTVILAWLASRNELSRSVDRIDRNIDGLRSEISAMHNEIVALRNDHHKDNLALMGYMVPLHERMAKLESRS